MEVFRKTGCSVATAMLLCVVLSGIAHGQTFTSSGSITISNGAPAAASPYPTSGTCTNAACIAVSGLSGTFVSMAMTLNYSTAPTQAFSSPAILLQSPSGANLDVLSFGCALNSTQSNVSFTLSDSAGKLFPSGSCPALTGPFLATHYNAGVPDNFPSPGPGTSGYNIAGNGTAGTGTANFAGTFGSGVFNGTWKLFVADQGDIGGGTVISSWSLTFTFSAGTATTTTLSAGSPNPAFTSGAGSSVSFSAHVQKADNSGPATNGTVTLHDNTTNTDLNSGSLNSSGNVTLTGTFSTEGPHDVIASYGGGTGFASSTSNHVTETANNHAVLTGTSLCNEGPITIPNGAPSGTASEPYPSNLILGNGEATLAGIIQHLTLTLKGFNYGNPQSLGMLLVAPNGSTAFEFMSETGQAASGAVNITFDDAASAALTPNTVLSSTSFKPTSDAALTGNADVYPSPAPQSFDQAAPTGSATFQQDFGGLGLTGTWQLFVANRGSNGTPGTISGGWCLNLNMQSGAHGTSTTVTGTPNPAPSGAQVTITATVTSDTTVNAGSVTFTDGTATLGVNSVSNGVATLQTSSLAEGTHHIIASYSGTTTGTIFGVSSNNYNQRIDTATVESGTQPFVFCNPGSITVPGGGAVLGAAGPYPSNILVSNLPGTVDALTVSLKQFTANRINGFTSLLVGPGGANLDFFSKAGGIGSITSPINLTLDDTAAFGVPAPPTTGTFKPTSATLGNTYPACPPNATNCTSPPVGPPLANNPFIPSNFAQPAGTAILGNVNGAGVFGGTAASTFNGNGVWSLYLDETFEDANNATFAGGWCLNFTENLPVLSLTKSHTGSFTQGQQGALFTLVATNKGPGPTGGVTTVTDTFPTGLTPTGAGAGTDTTWNCSANTQTVTCTNSAAVPAGNNFPALTLGANVSQTATAGTNSLQNQASISGGGSAGSVNSNTDNITILAAPDLTVLKQHTGTLVQGGTVSYTITVSNSAAGSTTSGQVTMVDTPPSGFVWNSGSSSPNGWACSLSSSQVMCTITQAVSGGSSYPAITLVFNIPSNASASVTNTATVSGGGEFNTANDSSNDTATVVQNTTTTAANATATFSAADQSVTLTATVAASPLTVNSGTVTFTVKNGGTTIGAPVTSGTVTNGSASASFTLPGGTAAGTYTINAVYNPGTGFTGSSDSTHTLTVNSVACSPQASVASGFSVSASGFGIILKTGHYAQTIQLTNMSGADIRNVNFVLDNLTNATLTNGTGVTSCTTPAGSPFISVGTVPNGQTAVVKLDLIKSPGTISYTMRLLGNSGTP